MSGWVNGKLKMGSNEYNFQAKVYDEQPYGIGINGGRISKLYISEQGREIARYDRKWDLIPEDDDIEVFARVKNFLEQSRP